MTTIATTTTKLLLSDKITSSPKPIVSTPSPFTSSPTTISTNVTTRNSSDIMLETPESSSETKRKSWLQRSLLNKKSSKHVGGNNKSPVSVDQQPQQQQEEITVKSEAASIADEYQRQSSSFESNRGEEEPAIPMTRSSSSSTNSNSNKKKLLDGLTRIHSINTPDVLIGKLKSSKKRFSGHHHHHHHHRSNSTHVKNNNEPILITTTTPAAATTKNPNNNKSGRRHSFDSLHSSSYIKKETSPSLSSEEEPDEENTYEMGGKISRQIVPLNHKDTALTTWDQQRGGGRGRPDFNLVVSNIDHEDEYINPTTTAEEEEAFYSQIVSENEEEEFEDPVEEKGGSNTPALIENDEQKIFVFDYFSLPVEIKSLIDIYEHKGKVERKKMVVRYKKLSAVKDRVVEEQAEVDDSEEDDEEDEEEDQEDEEDEELEEETTQDTMDYKDLITGLSAPPSNTQQQKDVREIAIVTTNKSDNIEFTKLIQLMASPTTKEDNNYDGPLLDLHVSLFGDQTTTTDNSNNLITEKLQDTIQSIDKNLEMYQQYKEESKIFIAKHLETMKKLNIFISSPPQDDDSVGTLFRISSSPNLKGGQQQEQQQPISDEPESISSSPSSVSSSSSSSSSLRNQQGSTTTDTLTTKPRPQSMFIDKNKIRSRDPFDERKNQVSTVISSLKQDLHGFQDNLKLTEEFVHDVQLDMDDTRNRMETYIKDIPESHYSAVSLFG